MSIIILSHLGIKCHLCITSHVIPWPCPALCSHLAVDSSRPHALWSLGARCDVIVDLCVQEVTHSVLLLCCRVHVQVTKVTWCQVASWPWCFCLSSDLLLNIATILYWTTVSELGCNILSSGIIITCIVITRSWKILAIIIWVWKSLLRRRPLCCSRIFYSWQSINTQLI